MDGECLKRTVCILGCCGPLKIPFKDGNARLRPFGQTVISQVGFETFFLPPNLETSRLPQAREAEIIAWGKPYEESPDSIGQGAG